MGKQTENSRERRRRRVRAKVHGTPERLRLNVFRSNEHIYAQVIDDIAGHTLAAASSLDTSTKALGKMTTVQEAGAIGKLVAERATAKNIKKVVFDRAGYLYHGRVKAVADGARAGGLEF